ncbi:uncharacterized protein SPAPADRAFT_47806 [Spathaspora passalidarum NRRL Y-27907]|uniref:Uncharacterized protein n=1 Tax=Spathaspora passalidarum (strain NRRL Y-27907 / 11-Y1) TaxID=619300 RepID=G3ADZ7_SPAPN|nr:uncharacterized protein SPAPADRAFT_47806 [Spathaspora passalidarum NRRL Y-27907]EGW34721.1 hypothetical protein SPAPADRAFT_47806 [Spathaspora passalidarum NRRL Y-27907]
MRQRQFCIASPCRKFVATTKSNNALEIQNVDKTILNTFNIQNIVANYLKTQTRNTFVDIKQVEWEHILPNSSSKLIAVVVDNHALVVIIDITDTVSPSIIIRQTKHDGIEKCQWIPPPSDIQQTNEGAYSNSRQIAVFTKHRLSLKVYSLDCTHILFTIEKPVIDHIIIRPNKDYRFWSILGNTREYNSAPILYHFYNQGSISVLIHKIRLSHPYITPPHITWSESGNWISVFNDDETLFGYHLMVYSFLGITEPKRVRPIIDVEFSTEGFEYRDNSPAEMSPVKFTHNWLSTNESEYFLISRIIDANIKVQIVAMKLLRVVKDVTLEIPQLIQGWKQEENRIHFGQVALPTKHTITQVIIENYKAFFILNSSVILYYEVVYKEDQFEFDLKTVITTIEPIIDVMIREDKIVICTNSQVLLYDMTKSNLESIFKSFTKISRISYEKELIVFYDQLVHWQVIEGKNNEALVLKKRNLLSAALADDSTITDTFNLKKRVKRS